MRSKTCSSPLKHLLIHFCIVIQRLAAVETPADKAVFHVIQSVKQLWVMFAVDSILDPHTAKKEPRLYEQTPCGEETEEQLQHLWDY